MTLNLPNLSPDTLYTIIGIVLSLIAAVAHSRGYRIPIIETLLDKMLNTKPPAPVTPAPTPSPAQVDPNAPLPAVPPGAEDLFVKLLWEELQRLRAKAPSTPTPPAA